MEEPAKGNSKSNSNNPEINGMWKHAIQVSYEATKSAFPGGEIIAHLDHKSFKGWQKNAIVNFLTEHSIRVGKPGDFF
ncbi:D-aminoacyl-tRNA deacylase [Carex littledalei]|uniref:D-aminoacyl-tRNA deacylase n=1 Tax=Carex littledalei TaxID=544730 RepID=A0A833QRB9_9POAL|nr:D-aminoacyl-tRNA deacylase [Carex littledalei]